mmetsp:Transcript_14946/g.21586  ORF Transcript_14946/g.21586 Transcript_14946/m.21586 type:complete len:122 (+) Transcript_14946:95-460(+)
MSPPSPPSSPSSPSPPSSSHSEEERKARVKDAGRDSRLSFRKFGEYQLRREYKDVALEKCAGAIKDFAECAQKQGLMVVFSCQKYNRGVQDCMAIHNSDEGFEKYKLEHQDELEKRSSLRG